MPVKVFIEPFQGRYRATCPVFGFELVADSKTEASRQMNDRIRRHVEELSKKGLVRESGTSTRRCPTAGFSACSGKGSSGCSSSG